MFVRMDCIVPWSMAKSIGISHFPLILLIPLMRELQYGTAYGVLT
jgi:hypothetical protein